MARGLTGTGEVASTSTDGRGQSRELGWGWKGVARGWGRGGGRKGEPLGRKGKGGRRKEVYYSSCRPIMRLLECRIPAPAARCDLFLLSWNINQRGPWVIGEF